MDFREIRQLSILEGTNRNPDSTEDGKFLKWNNSTGYAEYSQIGDGGDSDINTTYFTTFINNLVESGGNNYLNSITRIGDIGRFTLLSGDYHDLGLGALAWEDSVEAALTLPGDTKVLLDVADEVGGSANFVYDYTLGRLKLKAPLMFNTDETVYKEGLQYLGNYSFSVGNGLISSGLGSYNFTGGYSAGSTLGSTSSNNLILGPYAGQSAATTISDSIFIGPYAGRYETANDKFFLDNQDYTDTATAQDGSFMYAELGTERRLYIRDRLSVEKEGKFGFSELADINGEYGMYQMSASTGGQPQWHDGSVWQTFANSTNTYLDSVEYLDGDLTFTLSNSSTVGPIDISEVNVTSFATSPASPSTGQTTISNYGFIQISNSAFTDNDGFTYKTGLSWNNTTLELYVPGALNITTLTDDGSLSDNSIWTDGDHAYIKLDSTSIQLDNDALEGEINTGVNVGSGDVNWFKQKNDDDELEFRSFNLWAYDATYNPHSRLTQSSTDDGNTILLGTTAELNYLETTIGSTADRRFDRPKDGEMLPLRALREGAGVTLTQTDEYVLIDATGVGGGEVNTASNVGTIDFWYRKNSADLEFYGLDATDDRIVFTAADGGSGIYDNMLDLDLTIGANTTPLVSSVTSSDTLLYQVVDGANIAPVTWFKRLISDSIVFTTTVNNELRLEASSAAATGQNIGGGTISVFDDTSIMPDFGFRSISDTSRHMDVAYNGDLIEFDVDNIDWTNTATTGTDVFLIEQNETDSFIFTQKSIQGSGGITIYDEGSVDIYFSKEVPKFSFLTTPAYSGGTLSFNASYSSDIRTSDTLTTNTMFELNVGDGLTYTEATNTLSANISSTGGGTAGDASDYRLVSIVENNTTENYIRELTVGNGLGVNENVFNLIIPKSVLTTATYIDNTTPLIGGVMIDESIKTWTLGDTQQLTLDEATGSLSMVPSIVTYEAQNELKDINNATTINDSRDLARANIGAAYVNGSSTEDFNSKILTATDKVYCDHYTAFSGDAEFGSEVSQIEALIMRGNFLTSPASKDGVYITKRPSSLDFATQIGVKVGSMVLSVNADQGDGSYRFYKSDNDGNLTSLMKLDSDGNLYIKGNIYADGGIEGFNTDSW